MSEPTRIQRRDRRAATALPLDRQPSVRALHAINVCFARLFHRVDVLSPIRLPHRGPAILVCNHVSSLDPSLLQAVSPRIIVWMMAREYYQMTAMHWFYRRIRAIPVERSGRDMAATRAAMRALHEGLILGVFPEGKIETSRDLLAFHDGAAMMAIKARVPVYPAYVDGSQRGRDMLAACLSANRATVAFGPQVQFDRADSSRPTLERATAKIRLSIERLRALTESGRR